MEGLLGSIICNVVTTYKCILYKMMILKINYEGIIKIMSPRNLDHKYFYRQFLF